MTICLLGGHGPGELAVGKTFLVDPGSSGHATVPATVVGVVRHLRVRSLVEDLTEQVYFSADQVAAQSARVRRPDER